MELYNSLIKDEKELLPDVKSGDWAYNPADCWADIGSSELVLQKEAAYELGAGGKGSANLVLYTSNGDLVSDDRTVLYGPDIRDIKGDCDFARIVFLRIGMIDAEDEVIYRTLKDIEFAKYHVYPEGYMVRMSPESYREQVRVSRTAISHGLSFRKLGNNYIREYKKDVNVISAQVVFVTAPDIDYAALQKTARKANDVTGTLTHILEGLSTDCSVCQLKDICDEVDGMKELHFGIGSKGHS